MQELGTKKISTSLLIVSNVLVLILALVQNWSFANMLWIYWSQSIIIGFFHFFRLLFFRTGTLASLGRPPEVIVMGDKLDAKKLLALAQGPGSVFVAFFFAIHYGFFHYGYATFLLMFFGDHLGKTFLIIWPAIAIFAINHLISLILNWANDSDKNQTLEELFSGPYSRIMPMHMMIIIYGFLLSTLHSLNIPFLGQLGAAGQMPQTVGIIVFSLLKIWADVFGHNKKHKPAVLRDAVQGGESS